METERERDRGEHWPEEGVYFKVDVKKLFNWIRGKMKFIISLFILLVAPVAFGTDCFTPAHNMVGYSEDLTSATGWTKAATITDDSGTTTPPIQFNVSKTFKAVLAAGQSNISYGSSSNISLAGTGYFYLFSVYAKYSDRQYIGFGVTGGGTSVCSYDIQNGVAGVCSGGASSPEVTSAGGGWYKLSLLFSGSLASYPRLRVLFNNQTDIVSTTALAATGGEIVYLSSPQVQNVTDPATPALEQSKYIPQALFGIAWGPARRCDFEFLTRPKEIRTQAQIEAGSE